MQPIIRRLRSFVVSSALLVLAYWLTCAVTREADGAPTARVSLSMSAAGAVTPPDVGLKIPASGNYTVVSTQGTTFRTGAIVVAIGSGFYALAALLVGSPLEFGVALASCGGCWVTADFIEWTVERERAAGRRPVPAALLNSGYGSSYPVRVGADEYFSRPPHSHFTGMGAPRRRNLGWRMWSGPAEGYRVAGC